MQAEIDFSPLHAAGLGIVYDSAFAGLKNFSRQQGRYVISSRPANPSPMEFMPPWVASLWVQPAGGRLISGLWAGYAYITRDRETLFEMITAFCLSCDTRTATDPTHIRITTDREKIFRNAPADSPVREIRFYDLREAADEEAPWVNVTRRQLLDFGVMHGHAPDAEGWVEVPQDGVTLLYRLPADDGEASFPLQIAVRNDAGGDWPAGDKIAPPLHDFGAYLNGTFVGWA